MPLPVDHEWARVWASLSDELLEETLYHYEWLGMHTPNSHAGRIEQIKAEALRRGRPEIIEHVSAIMQLYGLPRPSDPEV